MITSESDRKMFQTEAAGTFPEYQLDQEFNLELHLTRSS